LVSPRAAGGFVSSRLRSCAPSAAQIRALIAVSAFTTQSRAPPAATKQPSNCTVVPLTSPAPTHSRTVRTNNSANTAPRHRARAFASTL
jgi:hypothetical protein